MSADHEQFMRMAVEESRLGLEAGERPFGSVVVRDGEVIGRGRNLTNSTYDPTAHAETLAIRDASARLKTPHLTGCTLYTSCNPCPMCGGAILYAGIGTLVIAARLEKLGELTGGYKDVTYTPEKLAVLWNARLEVVRGVLQEESEAILAAYPWRG